MIRSTVLFGAMSVGMLGCGASVPSDLADARDAYKQASQGPAAQYDPASLHKAKRSLELAERTYKIEGDSTSTRDRAYVAKRQSQMATVQGRTVQTETYVAELEEELEAARAEKLAQARALLIAQQAELDTLAKAAETKEQPAPMPPRSTTITLSGSVLFNTGEAELHPNARERLEEVAQSLTTNFQNAQIVVKGHTDNRGTRALNDRLSLRRAEAVVRFLVQHGVDQDRIEAKGMGFSEPVASNRTPEGRANNRRVEIEVTQQGESLEKPGSEKP